MCLLYNGVKLLSLIFLKRKRATVSKTLEKRESIVSVASSSFSELLDMLRNCDKSGRLLTKQSFVDILVTRSRIYGFSYTEFTQEYIMI